MRSCPAEPLPRDTNLCEAGLFIAQPYFDAMSQRTVATRYASALVDEAHDTGRVETIDADIAMLRDTLAENDELARFFKSPVLSADQKSRVARALLDGQVDALTLKFVQLLTSKRRATLIEQIVEAYQTIRREQEGIVPVQVRTAHALDDAERTALVQALESLTEATVELHTTRDESLLGGAVIRIGDRVYDGSVHHKLEALRDRFRTQSRTAAA